MRAIPSLLQVHASDVPDRCAINFGTRLNRLRGQGRLEGQGNCLKAILHSTKDGMRYAHAIIFTIFACSVQCTEPTNLAQLRSFGGWLRTHQPTFGIIRTIYVSAALPWFIIVLPDSHLYESDVDWYLRLLDVLQYGASSQQVWQ